MFSEGVPGSSAGYKALRQWVQEEKIGRVVYLVQYDQARSFFDPESIEEETFLKLLSSYPFPPACQLELMFDEKSFSYQSKKKWKAPDYTLRSYFPFKDLKNKLDYFADLYEKARGAITGIVLHPEEMGRLNDLQKEINYMDAYVHLNAFSHYVKKGMVLRGDMEKFIFLNREPLPVHKQSPLGLFVTQTALDAFPLGEKPIWRRNDSSPLLDRVYANVCFYETPALFETIAENPQQGAKNFLSLLTLTPYKKGGGLIKMVRGGKEVKGKETSFVLEMIPGTPIGLKSNVPSCNFVKEKPQSHEFVTLKGPSSLSSGDYVPYYVVEALMNYQVFPMTRDKGEGIIWMLSFKPRHFGRYSKNTLAHFMEGIKTEPFFQDAPHFALSIFEDIH